VSRDRSLEEFIAETSADRNDAESETPTAETDESEDAEYTDRASENESEDGEEGTDSDPMATTYRWSAEGGACGVCGERAEARWRSEGAFVCADCKEW